MTAALTAPIAVPCLRHFYNNEFVARRSADAFADLTQTLNTSNARPAFLTHSMYQEDDKNTGQPNCNDAVINSRRDLEDFMRLHVKLDGDLAGMPGIEMELGFTGVGSGIPGVQLFEAVDASDDFHSVPAVATEQAQKGMVAVAHADVGWGVFPARFFNASDNIAPFLLEGFREGRGCLSVRIRWHGTEIDRASVIISFSQSVTINPYGERTFEYDGRIDQFWREKKKWIEDAKTALREGRYPEKVDIDAFIKAKEKDAKGER